MKYIIIIFIPRSLKYVKNKWIFRDIWYGCCIYKRICRMLVISYKF